MPMIEEIYLVQISPSIWRITYEDKIGNALQFAFLSTDQLRQLSNMIKERLL